MTLKQLIDKYSVSLDDLVLYVDDERILDRSSFYWFFDYSVLKFLPPEFPGDTLVCFLSDDSPDS